ncbi:ROK family protein [Virgibacillus litoralis]|uniref:Glucokinase n=1 Tax=Virgibacillus litoralis TaxID=578221 RepID=A0ABS4HBZ8_9BACI|nr:ROK family protein [Virgibacillus litoralis]MBP1948420.1 glucokinase [Virgibacillus litoralis]
MGDFSIGIDIGGTKIAAGIVNKTGEVFHRKVTPTPKETKMRVLELLKDIVSSYISIAEKERMHLIGIGIGSAGQINYKEGKILTGTDNIQDWNDVAISDYLSKYTDLPIFLDNDATTFAIAEHQLGSGKGMSDVVCLTLGTGIGGGIISGGNVIRGEWGGAAELGHITVNMDGPKCNCGSHGCVETYASGSGIANRMKERLHELDTTTNESAKTYFVENPDKLTSKEVFQWYHDGCPIADEVIDTAIKALSYGMITIIHTFNPSRIILGGGIVEDREWLIVKINDRLSNLGMHALVNPVDIQISKLGYDAGLIGAAYQSWIANK